MFKLLIFLGCIAWLSIVQAADMVIIRSNPAQLLPKGKLLDSRTPLNLPIDSEVTVVFASGGVLTVTGPFNGNLTDPLATTRAADPHLITALSDFIRNEPPKYRGEQKDIWLVDITTPKRFYCVAATDQVVLWRSDSDSASNLLIKHKPTSQQMQLAWPAHQPTLVWPNNLPIVYGDTYTVEVNTQWGSSTFKKLVLYQVPDNLPTKSHKVVWMVGRGCIPQANMLLANLR